MATAIDKVNGAQALLTGAQDIAGKRHEQIAANTLDQIDGALRGAITDLEGITGSPFADLVAPTAASLRGYAEGDFAAFRAAHVKWRAEHPRDVSTYEHAVDRMARSDAAYQKTLETGSWLDRMFANIGRSYSAEGEAMAVGLPQMVTGGAVEQERQLGLTYDAGQISYENWEKGVKAASRRGWIFGGVMAALTVATFGLGLYIGPSLGFGGTVLFGAGTGLVTAGGPMIASNIFTSAVHFDDLGMQRWWKSGSYSAGQIAFASLLGAGIGAAFPVAGRLLGGLRRQGAQAAAALAAGSALPEGVVATTVREGVVDLAIASEGITIRVTRTGYQVIGRAGANPAAIIEEGNWPAEMVGQQGLSPGSRVDIAHPSFPTSVGFGERGWGLVSPQSSRALQFGFWPELALPAGTAAAEPAATLSPLLIDAAAGVPVSSIAGSDSALVLAGASIPHGLPLAPTPLMLGAGPVPFGYLPAPIPWITQTSPLIPQSFEQSVTSQWGHAVAQRGTGMLPFAGEGAVYLRMPSGEWGPAYYNTRPGGIPATRLTTYGTGPSDFLSDVPGVTRSALVAPRPGGSYRGPRNFPMQTSDMFDPLLNLNQGRGHLVPHAATKTPGPGQALSTSDPHNYVAHPRKYNEWIRNQLEQMLKRQQATYTAHDIIGANPRLTSSGYIIPEAEIWIEYGPNGAPVRSWRFPLQNPSLYENLTGSFKDVLPQFELDLGQVPTTPVGR